MEKKGNNNSNTDLNGTGSNASSPPEGSQKPLSSNNQSDDMKSKELTNSTSEIIKEQEKKTEETKSLRRKRKKMDVPSFYKEELGHRLKKIAKEQFGSSKELAGLLNMKPQTFQLYVAGKALPGGYILKRLSELGVDIQYLLTGVNKLDELKRTLETERTERTKSNGFPLVSLLSAGGMIEFFINENTQRIPFDYEKKGNNCLVLEVVGESMSPTIENGDYVLIDTTLPLFNHCIVAVRFKNGEQLIKRYTKLSVNSKYSSNPKIPIEESFGSDMVQFDSDNLEYKPIIAKLEDIEMIAPVVKIQRDVYSRNKVRLRNGV